MESASESFYILDAHLNFIELNKKALEITGFEREDIIGKNIVDVVPDVRSSGEYGRYLEIIRTGASYVREHTIEHPRFGTMHFVEKSFKVGDGLGLMALDITGRKLAENALCESRELFEQFMMLSPIYAYIKEITSDESVVLQASDSFKTLIGLSGRDIRGKTMHELFPAEFADKMIADDRRVIEENTVLKIEEEFDGRHFTTIKFPIVRRGKTFLAGYTIDITDSKRMKEELLKAQRLESLGILAGGIAHDFNNLLGGIFGYIDLAHAATTDSAVSGFLSKTLSTLQRAKGLTQQLLTFAKGGVPVKKPERFSPFIQEAVQFALSGSKCSCTFNVPETLWGGEFDKNQIGQVIDNIIINAQQAMPEGGPIEVSAENVNFGDRAHEPLSAGNYVRISIKDHGVGMPKTILPRIFDPFYTTKPSGHGLGLATCYSIITRHGGGIEVESEPGAGSTFHVYIPAAPDTAAETAVAAATVHNGAGTILVMDDEAVIRDTIVEMLKMFGYCALPVKNGAEALEAFTRDSAAERKFSGMICDLTIPGGIGGKELIGKVRKIDKDIPVFVVSGYADDPIMADPGRYGFTASICKPFRITEVAEILDKHIKAKK